MIANLFIKDIFVILIKLSIKDYITQCNLDAKKKSCFYETGKEEDSDIIKNESSNMGLV